MDAVAVPILGRIVVGAPIFAVEERSGVTSSFVIWPPLPPSACARRGRQSYVLRHVRHGGQARRCG